MSNDVPPPYGETPGEPGEPEEPRYDTYPQYGAPPPNPGWGAPGAAQPPPYAPTGPVAPAAGATSGKAVAAPVLGILGFFCCPITSVVGIVLGRIASREIRESQGRRSGAGLATAGFVVSIVSLVVGLGFWGLVVIGLAADDGNDSCSSFVTPSGQTTDC